MMSCGPAPNGPISAIRVLRASGIETETLFPTADKVIAKFTRITQHLPWLERDRIVETVLALDQLPAIGALTALLKGPAE